MSFDLNRPLEDKAFYSACYAPTTSMYFDQMGMVRACCQNSEGLLGSIRDQTIREIWESASADKLRSALSVGDFSVGCGFCKWQVDEGGTSAFARDFDVLEVTSVEPQWPVQMEFSLTNSCNLQCIMCNGDWSSSIRSHREHRAPLPVVYDDTFFDQLAEFLPHLQHARFLGGEPFLGKEPLRVMEMMIEQELDIDIAVTTNATQWSPRIERICRELPISFVVSLDGITKETYEQIRVGADFDEVMKNIDRFIEVAATHGRTVSITHCLMRPNWHEFADLLQFAENKGLSAVGINSVVFPQNLSLYQMSSQELSPIVDSMESDQGGRAAALQRFRPVWDEQIQSLRNRVRTLDTDVAVMLDPWSGRSTSGPSPTSPAFLPLEDSALSELQAWAPSSPVLEVVCSSKEVLFGANWVNRPILRVDSNFCELVGREADSLLGTPMSAVFDALSFAFGNEYTIAAGPSGMANNVQVEFRSVEGDVVQAQVLLIENEHEVQMLIVHRLLPSGTSLE